MKTYEQTLLHYAKTILTEEQLQVLIDNNVPLFGSNGLRRYLGEQSIEAFIKLYFYDEFYLDFPDIHLRMLQDLQEIRNRQVTKKPGIKIARAIPRNHAKSTFYSRILPLHAFLYNWSSLTVLLGNNDDSARRLVVNIKNAIETNPAIVEDFAGIKGQSWGYEKLESNKGAVITSYGTGSGSIRGISNPKRPALVILDDVDDDRSVRSTVELANNKDWLDKAVMALGDNVTYTTSYIAVGTIIRKTSLMKYILDSADFDSIVEQRIKRWSSNVELWQQWEQQYLTLAREGNQPKDASEDTFYQENKPALLQGTEVLWNKPDEYYYAMVYKLARGNKAFNSEMQNAPEEADSMFGVIPYVDLETINESEYDLLAALDPTTTGNKSSDYASYVEVLFHKKRKEMIVAYADVAQRSYTDTIDAVVQRIKNRGRLYQGFWIETNSSGLIIKDLITDRFRKEQIRVFPDGIHSSIPKNDRISTLSEYKTRGQLFFARNLPKVAIEQIEDWPLGKNDDFPDSLSMIVMKLADLRMLNLVEPIRTGVYST